MSPCFMLQRWVLIGVEVSMYLDFLTAWNPESIYLHWIVIEVEESIYIEG